MTESNPVFFSQGAKMVSLVDWLKWSSGKDVDDGWRVVLPMIQRGSVWKPHQIMDLWDTLLRGMPLGSMMASQVVPDQGAKSYFSPVTRELVTVQHSKALMLIDGQQRTLAMLQGWYEMREQRSQRVWVDLGENTQSDHLFRLHVTTHNQPFGYARATTSGTSVAKLSLHERRQANAFYEELVQKQPVIRLWTDDVFSPWHSTLPVELGSILEAGWSGQEAGIRKLVESRQQALCDALGKRISECREKDDSLLEQAVMHMERKRKALEKLSIDEHEMQSRLEYLKNAVNLLKSAHFPVIEVPESVMADEDDEDDPALAILFKRIGTGGTPLSNADYIYSVLKHRIPEFHGLVESLLEKKRRLQALMSPTDLVLTAVRIIALQVNPKEDAARLDKRQFARMIRKGGHEGGLLEAIKIGVGEKGRFSSQIETIVDLLAYVAGNPEDVGFPKHGLCLIKLPLLQLVLAWYAMALKCGEVDLTANRLPIIRFLLRGYLTISDPYKASELGIKLLLDMNSKSVPLALFPEEQMHDAIKEVSLPLSSPEQLEKVPGLVISPEGTTGLRGWMRFQKSGREGLNADEIATAAPTIDLYQRFWGTGSYQHPLLLWLQRAYVYSYFEGQAALPGNEEDTPYDYDHVCPQNHWHAWTGVAEGTRLIDFHSHKDDNQGHWRLGNAIGNVQVCSSSDNRSFGDVSPVNKLSLNDLPEKREPFLKAALISDDEIENWKDCSQDDDSKRLWTLTRALAFQKAIEHRTFNLYKRYYAAVVPPNQL